MSIAAKTLAFFLIFALSMPAMAAKIRAVKGKKVLIMMDGSEFSAGDRAVAISSSGKRRGLLLIKKVKGNKAYGILRKGKVKAGMTVVAGKGRGSKSSSSGYKSSEKKWAAGVLFGGAMDKLDATFPIADGGNGETVNMSGFGIQAKFHVDLNITSYLSLRAQAGMDIFKATGTSTVPPLVCTVAGDCFTTINYMAFDGWARYAFIDKSTKVWVGVGGGLLMPNTPDNTKNSAIDATALSTTGVFYFGLGADIGFGKKYFIPLYAHYTMFPSSTETSLSAIAFGAGFSFRF